jgi:restriction system protein
MECLGPECAALLLDWLKARAAAPTGGDAGNQPVSSSPRQALLWTVVPYHEEAPALRSVDELAGAIEHLQYAVFRRYTNQLTRAERARLDNTIDNALFKIDRYLLHASAADVKGYVDELAGLRQAIRDGREQSERRLYQARRAELKLAQLDSLTPESFEEFIADLFEMQGYEVERVGGSGDEGADLRLRRDDGLLAVVQCKYQKKSVVGSPALQRFLGTIHHTRSHKGYFVTTTTFSLSAEKFAANNPIELVDGPRLVELVHDAIGSKTLREPEPTWF